MPAVNDSVQADVDSVRLRAHAAASPLAALASALVAALLVWAAAAAIAPALWLGWGAALVAAVVLRAGLPFLHRRALPPLSPRRRLWQYRLLILVHGVVWGGVAWLPASLADPLLQASLMFVLVGLTVGAMTLTLFDLPAALLFAVPALLPLAARLGSQVRPLPTATAVIGVMALLLLALLTLAGRRAERERRALAQVRRSERLAAEGARDAQALLNQVFEHAGQGISVFDRDLRLRVWNPQLFNTTGLDPATVWAGMPLRDWVAGLALQGGQGLAADTEAAAHELERQVLALSEPRATVAQTLRADGRRIETRRNPLPDGGFVMFHVDITEREASRATATEQQRKLKLVLEITEQGFWYIDNDLRTTDANPAMCRMLGVDRAQLIGRSIYDFVDDDNRAVFEQHVRLRAEGHAEGYEIALTRADGRHVHCFNNATPVFDTSGRKIGALGLFSDISAQKRAELQIRQAGESLAQKSHVLEMTLDSLLQGVLNVDAKGRCTAWNHRFLELLQFPPELMANRPTLDLLLSYQLAHGHFGAQLERLDASGQHTVGLAQQGAPTLSGHRYRRTRADGTVLDVASHFAADGSLVRTFTDVTAGVAAEAALIAARDEAERAREEAETANRAKSEFLSRMSHELRTPLNAILGFGQLLQADADDPLSGGQRRQIDEMLRGGRHLLALINDVLDIARIDGGHLPLSLQPVDLAALAQDCLRLVQPMAQDRGVTLALQFGPSDTGWGVTADPTRLRQVLLNLLSNAIKFNREAGDVQVRGRVEPGGMLVEVADQGAGIAPDQVPRLFQAFERLDMEGAVEGTGIGLALSRSLVALMHGDIGVRSVPGQGSVFWVRLPASAGSVGLPDPPRVDCPPATGLSRHDVLYIEDNEVNQVLMEGMLAHRPAIALRLAAWPEEGLAMALAQPPDLVLLDIQLPGIDGFEVLRRMRTQPTLCRVPVIAVSANAMPDDLAEAQRAGFADYLTKPVDMPRLLALVDRALAGGSG